MLSRMPIPPSVFTKDSQRFYGGTLKKLGSVFAKWRPRYFVVDREYQLLIYYENETSLMCRGQIDLREYYIVEPDDETSDKGSDTSTKFSLRKPDDQTRHRYKDRVYHLSAANADEKRAWMQEIIQVCSGYYSSNESTRIIELYPADDLHDYLNFGPYKFYRVIVNLSKKETPIYLTVHDMVCPDGSRPLCTDSGESAFGKIVVPRGLRVSLLCLNASMEGFQGNSKRLILQSGDARRVVEGNGKLMEVGAILKTELSAELRRYAAFIIQKNDDEDVNWAAEKAKQDYENARRDAQDTTVGGVTLHIRYADGSMQIQLIGARQTSVGVGPAPGEAKMFVALCVLPDPQAEGMKSSRPVDKQKELKFSDENFTFAMDKPNSCLCVSYWEVESPISTRFHGFCLISPAFFNDKPEQQRQFPLFDLPKVMAPQPSKGKDTRRGSKDLLDMRRGSKDLMDLRRGSKDLDAAAASSSSSSTARRGSKDLVVDPESVAREFIVHLQTSIGNAPGFHGLRGYQRLTYDLSLD